MQYFRGSSLVRQAGMEGASDHEEYCTDETLASAELLESSLEGALNALGVRDVPARGTRSPFGAASRALEVLARSAGRGWARGAAAQVHAPLVAARPVDVKVDGGAR
jgi:hypothetical protein